MKAIFPKKNKKTIFLLYIIFFVSFFIFENDAFVISSISLENKSLYALAQESPSQMDVDGALAAKPAEPIRDVNNDGKIDPLKALSEGAIELFMIPVKWILYQILSFAGWLASIGATMLGWTLSDELWGSGKFLEKPVVYELWGMFRDILNMLFILMLLFSAFATIFQVSKYNIKKIFISMLLAVLLINFSYPIARIIIDISNVMMFSFLNGTSGLAIATDLMGTSGLEKILIPDDYKAYPVSYLLFAIMFVVIFAVSLVVLGVMLIIRLLALMMIIIVSPIGFLFSVFPGLDKYSGKWWDALFRYSFFGPIMAFALMASVKIMQSVGNDAKKISIISAKMNSPAGMGEDFTIWLANAAFFAMPVMLIWMAMGVANSMSIVGASEVVGRGQKFAKWTGQNFTGQKGLGGALAHWTNRKMAETKGLRYLSPMAMKDAWKKRTDRADRKAIAVSSGEIQNTLNQAIGRAASLNPFVAARRFMKGRKAGRGGFKNIFNPMDIDRTDYKYGELQAFKNEEKKRMGINENGGHILHEMDEAIARNEPGDAGTLLAGYDILASNNDFNEYSAKRGMTTLPQGTKISFMRDLIKAGMTDTDSIAKSLMATGEVAYSKGGMGYGGMSEFLDGKVDDRSEINYSNIRTVQELKKLEAARGVPFSNSHKGKIFPTGTYISTEEEQAKAGAAKFANQEPQQRQKNTHPDSYYELDSKGNVKGIHLGGRMTLKKLTSGDIKSAGRARDAVGPHWQAYKLYTETYPAGSEEAKAQKSVQETINSMSDREKAMTVAFWKECYNIVQNPPK